MANEVTIEMFGDVLFRRRITAMRYRARNMSPVLRDIGEKWIGWIEEQFATEGLRGGTKFEKLAFATVSKRGSAHPILIDKGDLLLDMTDPEHVRVTDNMLSLNLPEHSDFIAGLHQSGFEDRDGNPVPARPPIVFTPLDRQIMQRDLTGYLVNGDRV